MPAISSIALAVSAIGVATSAAGTIQANSANREASSQSQAQEALRRQQLELENIRRQRAIMRQAQAARAQAVASANTRGALQSDVLPGAIGQINAQEGSQLVAQSENTQISRGIFETNAAIAQARADAATGAAISDFGKTLFANSQAIGRLGNTFLDKGIGEWSTTTIIGGEGVNFS